VPGFFLVMALYLQEGFGLSPLWSGLTVTPFSVGILLTSPVSKRLGNRYLRERVVAGSLTLAAAHVALHFVVLAEQGTYSWIGFAPILFCAGFGLGSTTGPLFQIALSGASGTDTGSASGASRAIQQVGSAFGIAILGGIFFGTLGNAPDAGMSAYTAAMIASLYYTISVFLILAASAFFLRIKADPYSEDAAHAPVTE